MILMIFEVNWIKGLDRGFSGWMALADAGYRREQVARPITTDEDLSHFANLKTFPVVRRGAIRNYGYSYSQWNEER